DGGFQEARFPRLYALESYKRIDVAAKLAHSSVSYSFRRAPRSGSGNFSVASVRKLIDDRRLPYVSYKTRWIKAVPIKVNVHTWKVRLDSLPTRLNISRRENKLWKKDRTINQKHTKRREREVEVESVKEVQSFRTTGSGVENKLNNKLLKATPSPIQMAAIPLGWQQHDVIGVAETSSGAFVSRKPKMRVMIPIQ
nr:RNA-directed DNA polymerase, eukaryota [Tanacetum cinerariifolium]